MATYDTVVSVTGTGVGTLTTASFTISSGANRVAIASVSHQEEGITCTGVSGAGGAFTSCGTRVTNTGKVGYQWGRINPSSGSQTVTATFDDTWASRQTLAVVTATDADQTTGWADYTTATGNSTTPGGTVTNAASGDLVVDHVFGAGGGTATVGADQTERYDHMGTTALSCGSTQPGANGGAMTWTIEFGAEWVWAGVRIKNVAASGNAASSSGTSTATGSSASQATSVANSVSAATATARGSSAATSDANSVGTSSANAVGRTTISGAASSSGTGTATSVGATSSTSVANSAGTATANGVGISSASSVANAQGTATANAVGTSSSPGSSAASSSGTSTANASTASTALAVISSSGTSTATAVGAGGEEAEDGFFGPYGHAVVRKQKKKMEAQELARRIARDKADMEVISAILKSALDEYLKAA